MWVPNVYMQERRAREPVYDICSLPGEDLLQFNSPPNQNSRSDDSESQMTLEFLGTDS